MAKSWRVGYTVSKNSEELEWRVSLIEYSRFRDAIDTIGGCLCGWTGHRFEKTYFRVVNWAARAEKDVMKISISRDEAFALNPEFVTDSEKED